MAIILAAVGNCAELNCGPVLSNPGSPCQVATHPFKDIYSSLINADGFTPKARLTGTHVAIAPSSAIVATTPTSTSGSVGRIVHSPIKQRRGPNAAREANGLVSAQK